MVKELIVRALDSTIEYMVDHEWDDQDIVDVREILSLVVDGDDSGARTRFQELDTEPSERILEFVPEENLDAVLQYFDED